MDFGMLEFVGETKGQYIIHRRTLGGVRAHTYTRQATVQSQGITEYWRILSDARCIANALYQR
jgi:hypothetical protein